MQMAANKKAIQKIAWLLKYQYKYYNVFNTSFMFLTASALLTMAAFSSSFNL